MGDGMPQLGSTVDSPNGAGVVVDRVAADREVLVRLRSGTVLDTTHGQWWPIDRITVTGFNADAWVWWGQRVVPAGTIPERLR